MQKDTAHQLHIKGTKAQCALGGFTTVGKCFWQQIVQAFAIVGTPREFAGLSDQLFVTQRFELWL